MYLIINKLKFFILLILISSSGSAYAITCSILETHLVLDRNYVQGLEALGNKLSVPVKGKDNLRQTFPPSTLKTKDVCTEVHIVNNKGKTLRAVFANDDLTLQGLIINNKYYYFKDAQIRDLNGGSNQMVDLETAYETAQGRPISYDNMNDSVEVMLKASGEITMPIRRSLILIMFITTEALKFRSVSEVSVKILAKEKKNATWSDYSASIMNWETLSAAALKNGVILPENLVKAIGTKDDIQIAKRK
ncbi:MAG: hypothetical protein LBQ34_05425 [Alphaproteobacteria bacterium]|jgi:hypothetical protein|nr:hypothetical protein [Alphaproteobacteria bacterium]